MLRHQRRQPRAAHDRAEAAPAKLLAHLEEVAKLGVPADGGDVLLLGLLEGEAPQGQQRPLVACHVRGLAASNLGIADDAEHTSTVTTVNAKLVMRLSRALKSIRVIKSAHPLFSRRYRVRGNLGHSRPPSLPAPPRRRKRCC